MPKWIDVTDGPTPCSFETLQEYRTNCYKSQRNTALDALDRIVNARVGDQAHKAIEAAREVLDCFRVKPKTAVDAVVDEARADYSPEIRQQRINEELARQIDELRKRVGQ